MKPADTNLPRETSLPRVLSLLRRSRRILRAARLAHKRVPSPGTADRLRERILAILALRAKVAFVRANVDKAGPRGAARLSRLRKYARAYRVALARWQAFYACTMDAFPAPRE